MDTASNQPPASSIVLYQTEDGRTRIECWFEGETLCLSQALMAELFQISVSTINENIKALFSEGELSPGQLFGVSEEFVQNGKSSRVQLFDRIE